MTAREYVSKNLHFAKIKDYIDRISDINKCIGISHIVYRFIASDEEMCKKFNNFLIEDPGIKKDFNDVVESLSLRSLNEVIRNLGEYRDLIENIDICDNQDND